MKTSGWLVAGLLLSLWAWEGVAQAQPGSGQPGFYDVLTPHGDWLQVAGVGTVWRPFARTVGPDFYPYFSGGRWQYTEYGWAWDSDWEWGWVPFHHGRWLYTDDNGWVWIPDDVWGPAWVDWRIGGGYVGWVPMGPAGIEVTFGAYHPRWSWVHSRHFADREFHRDRLTDTRAEEEAFRVASPVVRRDLQAPRGPDPTLLMPPGIPVPRVTIGAPRRLERGAVTGERRLAAAPSGLSPRPLVTPVPTPFVRQPPEARPLTGNVREQPPVLRGERPEPGRPGPRPPQFQPGAPGPAAVAEPAEAEAARKKEKEKPKATVVVPGPPRGKPRGR